MSRIAMIAIALVAGLAGGAASQFLIPAPEPAGPDEVAIRAVVEDALSARAAERETAPMDVADIDQETLNPMIEDYLMSDPKVLQRMSDALQQQLRTEDMEQARVSLARFEEQIYDDPAHVVLGNPDGDVTLVEFFDYNCSYCRQSMPDLVALLDEDPDLRVILKEFPVLSEQSMQAARVSVVVAEQASSEDYFEFHQNLFTSRGQVDGDKALAAAEDIGLNPVEVELDASDRSVTRVLERSYEIAQGLNISGTPTYIIGDEIVPGAVGYEQLKSRIANMRECGSTVCDAEPASVAEAS